MQCPEVTTMSDGQGQWACPRTDTDLGDSVFSSPMIGQSLAFVWGEGITLAKKPAFVSFKCILIALAGKSNLYSEKRRTTKKTKIFF